MDTKDKNQSLEETDKNGILWMHIGHSANCSSIGSLIDFLFLGTVASATMINVITAIRSNNSQTQPEHDAKESPFNNQSDEQKKDSL